jgi:hypothetical protein
MKTKLLALASWTAFLVSAVAEWGFNFDLPLTPAVWLIVAMAVGGIGLSTAASGQVNTWTNPGSGTFAWDNGANWSAGSPLSGQSAFITNAVNALAGFRFRTIQIDSTTAGASMAVSNLTIKGVGTGFTGSHNTLLLSNAGTNTPLVIQDSLTISANGAVNITNSALTVYNNLFIDGAFIFNTGFILTDILSCNFLFCFPVGASTFIGHNGAGSFTMIDGRWDSGPVQVGSLAAQGTLTVSGGSVTMKLSISSGIVNALDVVNGTMWLTGGALATEGGGIGDTGAGQMIISNGTWTANSPANIGVNSGNGTLIVAGGTAAPVQIMLGADSTSLGVLSTTTGEVDTSDIFIGREGFGQMTVSNGTVFTGTLYAGWDIGAAGTLTMAGGTVNVLNWMYVSLSGCGQTGVVNMTGGSLLITNGAHTAFLELNGGTFDMSGGTLLADKLVVTNCAHFVHSGGTLTYGSLVLDPTGDADGDGLPNGWEQAHGLDPFSNIGNDGASGDPDGDGFTNLQEYLNGTDPHIPDSPLRITSILRQGNNVLLTWATIAGKTNVVQATAGASGSYSNNFADLSPVIIPTGSATNYLDVGGATNTPSRFYRVRLVP